MNTGKKFEIGAFNPAEDEALRLNPIGIVC
jgi:hypothetical protein